MKDELYNRALMEYMEIANHASIVHSPEFAQRVFSYDYWHASDAIYGRVVIKDYGNQELVFLCVTGGGIGAVLMLSLVLGIRKCLTKKEEEVLANEQLSREEDE